MRKTLSVVILLALGVALFIFTLKTVGVAKVEEALSLLDFWQSIFALIVLFFGMVVFGAIKWKAIIKSSIGGESIEDKAMPKLSTLVFIKWIGFSVSYITPAALFGGEPLRFYLLKKHSNVSSKRIASSIILDKLTLVLVSSIFFFLGVFALLFYLNLSWLAEGISFLIVAFIVLIFWFLVRRAGQISEEKGFVYSLAKIFRLHNLKFFKKNQEKILKIEKEVRLSFKLSKEAKLKILSLAALEVLTVALASWTIILFMGTRLRILQVFAIKSVVDFSYIIPFPAALGSLEISQAFVFQALGFSLASGVVFSLILRGLNLIIACFGLLIWAWMHIKSIGKGAIDFFSQFSI